MDAGVAQNFMGLDANLQTAVFVCYQTRSVLLLGVDRTRACRELGLILTQTSALTLLFENRVDPKNKKIISIPRDTMVDLENTESKRLTPHTAMAAHPEWSGPFPAGKRRHLALCRGRLGTFTKIVDSIGGVRSICLLPSLTCLPPGIDLPTGEQQLNGQQALGLFSQSPRVRQLRRRRLLSLTSQRMILTAIAKKVLQLDPVSMSGAVSAWPAPPTRVTDIVGAALSFKDMVVKDSVSLHARH